MSVAGEAPTAHEEELVRRMQDHDDTAFAILYERYFDKLYGFIYKRVGHHEVAEDLLSQVFLKAFTSRKGFGRKGKYFRAWLYTIATNTVTDHWRTKKETVSLEAAETVGKESGSIKDADRSLLHVKLQRALGTLPERDQLCVTLKYYGGYSHAEIAEITGLAENHVGVIIFRALKKCRAELPAGFESYA